MVRRGCIDLGYRDLTHPVAHVEAPRGPNHALPGVQDLMALQVQLVEGRQALLLGEADPFVVKMRNERGVLKVRETQSD